jgi:hypothetical protein
MPDTNNEYLVAFNLGGVEHLKEIVAHYKAHPEEAPRSLHS